MLILEQKIEKHLNSLLARYSALEMCKDEIIEAYLMMEECYKSGGKLLIVGNGGSAADAEHMVCELMKSFKLPRKVKNEYAQKLKDVNRELGEVLANQLQGALPAIAISGHTALSTAYMNDCDPVLCFSQQVNGYGKAEDVFLGISTSGNSENVIYAAIVAKSKGMKVVGLSGANKSKLSEIADVCVRVPNTETYMIQEYHLPIYHCWCLMLEEKFFGEQHA